jgi:hypothetical protein
LLLARAFPKPSRKRLGEEGSAKIQPRLRGFPEHGFSQRMAKAKPASPLKRAEFSLLNGDPAVNGRATEKV